MSVAYAPEAAPRRVIASKARAAEIVERIAAKHDLAVPTVLCARRDRFAMAARAEVAASIADELNWSTRSIGDYIGCSHTMVRKLLGFHEIAARRAKRWLPAADVHALARLEGNDLAQRALEAEERAAELEAEMVRLTGVHLAATLGQAIELGGEHGGRFGGVVLLSIVVEAYPNAVLGPNLLELYDEACGKLGFGRSSGVGYELMAKNASNIAKHFREKGWPVPTEPGDLPASRRLTHEAARMLHEKIGFPRLSQMELAAQRGSAPVRA